MDDSAAGIFIKRQDDVDDLLRVAIVSQDSPGHYSVHHVKRILDVNKTDIQRLSIMMPRVATWSVHGLPVCSSLRLASSAFLIL